MAASRKPTPRKSTDFASFCPNVGILKILRQSVDMQPQEPRVGWRSSRQLVPKDFCGSALACECSMRIRSEVSIDVRTMIRFSKTNSEEVN